MKQVILCTALALASSLAAAAVEVRFVKPAEFSDLRDGHFSMRDEVLKDIEAHFRRLAEKQLPGKDLMIEVTDVDLAGMVEPVGRRMEMMRVVREIGSPAMELRFVLSENGQELRRGEAKLRDMAFMNRFSRYSEGDSLRYEKRMMDDWFSAEFSKK